MKGFFSLMLILSFSVHAEIPKVGLTNHFIEWLDKSHYRSYGFSRRDIQGGSFGGKESGIEILHNDPVIFVHGSGGRAWGGLLGGWEVVVGEFIKNGYAPSELYATTYDSVVTSAHTDDIISFVANFINAVHEYTEAERVDIIAHSLGVTVSRIGILRNDLGSRIDTFVSIAGANRGYPGCYYSPLIFTPGCSMINGLHPGSELVRELNLKIGYEGKYRYSIWSPVDQVIGHGCQVWMGIFTCPLPGQIGQSVVPLGHVGLRDFTAGTQIKMVRDHSY